MSLDNIQLPAFLLQQLYKNSLVDPGNGSTTIDPVQKNELLFLGNNQEKVLLVVNEPGVMYLADEDLDFLMGILSACKLSMHDVILLNFHKNPETHYQDLLKTFTPGKILLFGIEPAKLQFPLEFPYYQLQQYNQQTYLYSPSLKQLAADKQLKVQLWASLKKLFLI